ncbi:MAG: tetratricopeptide repeat protein [Desulfomonilaceae bacterium]|nr:tetratricopeptide repeat protein [Desulfomonilaceae bacterium]
MTLPGRNDPCPCGSGFKYKKCCANKNTENDADDGRTAPIRAKAFKDMSEENWFSAIEGFKEILSDVRDPHTILEAIASCYDGLENYPAAAEYYEKALTVCPESRLYSTYYRLGVARACAERMEKASDAFRKCLEFSADTQNEEHIRRIIRQLDETVAGNADPKLFRVHVQLQRVFSDMDGDRYENAAARLEQLLAIDPENSAIFYNLGVVYTFLNREDEAIAYFEKAVELSPEYVEAYYNLGQIYLIKKRDFSQALNYFDRAASIRPDYIGAHHQRGVAYEMVGDKQKAVECWRRTLELDPKNKQARENIERMGGSV